MNEKRGTRNRKGQHKRHEQYEHMLMKKKGGDGTETMRKKNMKIWKH